MIGLTDLSESIVVCESVINVNLLGLAEKGLYNSNDKAVVPHDLMQIVCGFYRSASPFNFSRFPLYRGELSSIAH